VFNKNFGVVTKMSVRLDLRFNHGLGFFDIQKAINKAEELPDGGFAGLCHAVCSDCGITPPPAFLAGAEGVPEQGAIGDGSILKAIGEWLRSPEGRAFISALAQALMMLLMGI
jgi:hypothetical protein